MVLGLLVSLIQPIKIDYRQYDSQTNTLTQVRSFFTVSTSKLDGLNTGVYQEIQSEDDFKAIQQPSFPNLLEFTTLNNEFAYLLYQEALLGDFNSLCLTCSVKTMKFMCDGKSSNTRCNNWE